MKIKRLAFIFAVLAAAVALAACSSAPALTVQNEKLTFVKAEIVAAYEGITPPEGGRLLTVRFVLDNAEADLAPVADAFFSSDPCVLSIGADTYPCKSIAFENSSGRIIAVPVFEVPASLSKGAVCTLSGNSFSPLQFTV